MTTPTRQLVFALPKGRILKEALPLLRAAGIEPEAALFDEDSRALRFATSRADVSLIRVPHWVDGITAGAGWIALAIVVFASWKPWRVLIGAYLFGGITVLQLNLQVAGSAIPVEYLSMAPYLITILVLVIMSAGRKGKANGAPASLGQNFHASR